MASIPKTLADLTYDVAVELRSVREGVVTSAANDKIIDVTRRTETVDYWNKGPAWILKANSGSAPQGQFGTVSDFAGGTITMDANFTATVPVGARYAVGRRRYPLDVIKMFLNAAYRDLGRVPNTDESVITATQSTQYTLPSAVAKDLREVYIQTVIGIDDDKGWVKIPYGAWRQEENILYISQLPIDRILKLVYVDETVDLMEYTDTLSPYVHPRRVVYKAVADCLSWRAERLSPAQQNQINQRINYFLDLDMQAKFEHHIVIPQKPNKLFVPSWRYDTEHDEFNAPYIP